MKFDLLALLAISLAAMFFGYYFGLFEGRGQGYTKRKKEEGDHGGASQTAGASTKGGAAPAASDSDPGMLRLGRDANGHPSLMLDGIPVEEPALTADQRKRLIDLMLVMRPWVEGNAPPATAPDPPPSMRDRARGAAGAAPAISPQMSIVDQIDAVLQLRLAGTALASLGIKLIDSAEGGVTVAVGSDKYATVGDVPQPEVQAAIRGAIAEWEQKYAPG